MLPNEMETELNIEDFDALLAYLRQRGSVTALDRPKVCKLDGGVSNRVVLVKTKGDSFVVKQALEKLRVEIDWFCTPARIEREALALKFLNELAPAGSVPRFLFEDPSNHVLAMAAVPEPHRNWKQMLLSGEVITEHVEQFGALLGCIHGRSSERLPELLDRFDDISIFESLRIEPYYRFTAARVPQAARFLNQLIADMLAWRACLVHGDYSPKNILVQGGRLVLLDYEVVHFGDPMFDIGFSLAHLLSKAHHCLEMRARFGEAATRYWQTYIGSVGKYHWASIAQPRAVRHTLACCLARVAGRSPLEYLNRGERRDQANLVLRMMEAAPTSVPDLISEYIAQLPWPSSKN
jgi:5-methylthioribose kinase